jgi:hypothetical protein
MLSRHVQMERDGIGRHLKEPDGIGEHNNKGQFVPCGGVVQLVRTLPVTQEAAGSSPVAPATNVYAVEPLLDGV